MGGRAVDRLGTRKIFLLAHISYAVVILFMLVRHWMPWSLVVHVGICSFFFGLVGAAAGIAISSEVLALIPSANKSLSTAVNMSLINWGIALSGIFVSQSITWNIFTDEWTLFNQELFDLRYPASGLCHNDYPVACDDRSCAENR